MYLCVRLAVAGRARPDSLSKPRVVSLAHRPPSPPAPRQSEEGEPAEPTRAPCEQDRTLHAPQAGAREPRRAPTAALSGVAPMEEDVLDKLEDMASVRDFDPLTGSIPATKVEVTVSCR